jgi:proliferating cell nuclear antigen PCNA
MCQSTRAPHKLADTYIMEFIPTDSALFRSCIDGLKEFLPTAQIHADREGLRIRGMDVSHVGFIDYFLSTKDCVELKVPSSATVVGMNLSVLSRALASVGPGDTVTVKTAGDKLNVSYANTRASKKAEYSVPTLDCDQDVMEIPSFEYAATVRSRTADIAAVVKEVAHFGDTVELCLDEEGFHVSVNGDIGAVKQTLENTDERDMEMTEDSVTSKFAIKYLMNIMKSGTPLASTMTLEFGQAGAQPLRASFRFGNESYFVAYLAAKIDDM